MAKTLIIRNLNAGYGKKTILRGISLEAEKGRLYALLGPNGSGKSTLLKTILKETTVSGGSIEIEGRDIASLSQRELSSHLAFVPQKAIVPEGFTVRDVLSMAAGREKPMDDKTIDDALEESGILHLKDRMAAELSGGELQLVLLSRAVATGHDLLLLDEPTSSLDISNQERILEMARNMAKNGKTVLMTVHDLNAAYTYADVVVVLKDGEKKAMGTPEETITEAMLRDVYGSKATIHKASDGTVFIA